MLYYVDRRENWFSKMCVYSTALYKDTWKLICSEQRRAFRALTIAKRVILGKLKNTLNSRDKRLDFRDA